MTEAPRAAETDQTARRAQRLSYGVAAIKLTFMLAGFRLFAAPMTKDLLGEQLLPWPTWEWSLCALTPMILIYCARRPEDWAKLAGERTFLKITLHFYFLYAITFAIFQGVWILWIAVAAALGGYAGIWRLNRKESPGAH